MASFLFPAPKYSRTSLYITGPLPHLDTLSNQATSPIIFPNTAGLWDGRHVGWQACGMADMFVEADIWTASIKDRPAAFWPWISCLVRFSKEGKPSGSPDSSRLVEERLTDLPVDEGNTYPGKSLALAWRYEYWAAILRITQRSRLLKVLCVSRLLP